MKKGNIIILIAVIIVFGLITVAFFGGGPMYLNVASWFFGTTTASKAHIGMITLGIMEGIFITLYIQSLLKDVKSQEPEKFDLEG